MTIIVGLVDPSTKRVVMGADMRSTSGWTAIPLPEATGKLWRRGRMLFGHSGVVRNRQLIEFWPDMPSPLEGERSAQDAESWFVEHFVPRMMKRLEDGGSLNIKDGEKNFDSRLLVGVDTHLFTLWGNFQVGTSARGYQCIGCGEEFAYGSLYSTSALALSAEDRVKRALEAACEFSVGCAPPFTVLTT